MADKMRAMGWQEWTAFFSWIILTILIVTKNEKESSSDFHFISLTNSRINTHQ